MKKHKAIITITEDNEALKVRCDFWPQLDIENPSKAHAQAIELLSNLYDKTPDAAITVACKTGAKKRAAQ